MSLLLYLRKRTIVPHGTIVLVALLLATNVGALICAICQIFSEILVIFFFYGIMNYILYPEEE